LLAVGVRVLCSTMRAGAQTETNRQLDRSGPNHPEAKRIALVIGNGLYAGAPPLRNPPNDARDIAAMLKTVGFEVTLGVNVNQREMKRLIRDLAQKLKSGGVGLFYYAGHGVQSKGHNYLIPVDADIQSEAEVEDSGVDLSLVLSLMDEAQNGLNIIILDACRNNPFGRSFRSASEGLAQVDAPTGTLIAYATAPGRVASDGTGQNGLYTSELLKAMRTPGLTATDVFMKVRAEVMKQTGNNQVPWEVSSLTGAFYFDSKAKDESNVNSGRGGDISSSNKPVDPTVFELSFWETIKNSADPEDFRSYLEKYPEGQFSAIAKRRLTASSNARENQPSETDVDPSVRVLSNLGSTKISLGQFGEAVETVSVAGRCSIKYEDRALWNSKARRFKPTIGETIILLSEVNTASIAASEVTPPDRPAVWGVTARTIAGRAFKYSITGYENRSLEQVKIPTKTQNPTVAVIGIFVDAESAKQYATAFAKAARLCGAKSETF
jgi:hypothetical protein